MTLANPAGLRVAIGDQMPSVGLRATDGYLLNLRTFVGKRPAIIVFFAGPSLRGAKRAQGDLMAMTLAEAFPRLERSGRRPDRSDHRLGARSRPLTSPSWSCPTCCSATSGGRRWTCLGIPTRNERGNINAEPTAFAVSIDGTVLDVVPRAEPRGLVARLLEAINPPS